ncbi:DUF952 domain-containing protein [Rhodococcus hoagii]|nr:DUF952 domain-containing protein [Prescottella equi]
MGRDAEDGHRLPPGFDVDGFVHLSTPAQVICPRIACSRAGPISCCCIWIPPVSAPRPGGSRACRRTGVDALPHLYGPLPAESVLEVTDYRPGADGLFPPVG